MYIKGFSLPPVKCLYFSFTSPIYASSFADVVLIRTRHSSLQRRLYLQTDVLYAIKDLLKKQIIIKKDTQCLYYKGELGAGKVLYTLTSVKNKTHDVE